VKDAAIKRILEPCLTALAQVLLFGPTNMLNSSNFFQFVGDWHMNLSILRQHMKSYYTHNVFELVTIITTIKRDSNGQPKVDSNGNFVAVKSVVNQGSLLDVWHNVTLKTVAKSCRIYAKHSKDVNRQNLRWSWEFILANVDADLSHHIISKVEPMEDNVGQTGPMAFYLAAKKIILSTSNLAHNVISGLMVLELHHFQGKDVNECVFVLCNILKFLNHGHPKFDKTPPTIMQNIFDVFLHVSNMQFCNYIQQVKDFHLDMVMDPKQFFAKAQAYYNNIMTKPGKVWLPIKKVKAIFPAKLAQLTSSENSKPPVLQNVEQD
jgi:hypothetical protein